MEDENEVCLIVPPRSCHLRAVRLVAAEAGGRAGLDVSELDDLRIAVDELCYTLMAASDQRLLVRVVVDEGRVVVRGTSLLRSGQSPPSLPSVSELIVDAVSDHYAFEHEGDKLSFVVVKQGARNVSA